MTKMKSEFSVNSMNEATQIIQSFKPTASRQWFVIPNEVCDVCSVEASMLYGRLLGFSNRLCYTSNLTLANAMNCSSRTISRLLNELKEKGCIRVVVVSRSRRLIYPVYTLPVIYDIESSKDSIENRSDSNSNGLLNDFMNKIK